MKIIIAGGRSYRLSDADLAELNKLKDKVTEVVSGTAKGADSDGENWARTNGISIKKFKPDWARYGLAAGVIRNKEMADYADALAIFPGGRGTDNMYKNALKKGLKIFDFRKLKDFKEYIYQEGFGFDWSKLKPKQIQNLFRKSSKEIELSAVGKKIVKDLANSSNIQGVDEFDIRTAYSRLAIDNSPTTIRRKLENILKGPDAEISIKNLASPTIYRKFNIQQEIIRLDTELDKEGIKGLVYFDQEDKPHDLFRLMPVNQRKNLRLLKTDDDLLLSVKIFYAFKLAPVFHPSLGKSSKTIEDEEIKEEPYVFNYGKNRLNIDASKWQSNWRHKNKQINELEKNIKSLILEKQNLFSYMGSLGKQIVSQNKEYIDLILNYLKNNSQELTKSKFDDMCASANISPLGYDFFKKILGYSIKYNDINKKIKEQENLKLSLQKDKKNLSSVYFKPKYYVGKRKTDKSTRYGTIQAFLKEAANAFMKIMKMPKTNNQKMVQMHLIENCVNVYSQKNSDKDFDVIVYPESRRNQELVEKFGENFNKELAAEFSFKYNCPSVEVNKLPINKIFANEEGAKTYYELKGLNAEQIDEKIKRLRNATDKVRSSGQIKVLTKQEQDFRFFVSLYSKSVLANNDFKNKKILVIDDNTTSGATFQQISEILSSQDPYSIDFYVPFVR